MLLWRSATILSIVTIVGFLAWSSSGCACTLATCVDDLTVRLVGDVPDAFGVEASRELQTLIVSGQVRGRCSRDDMSDICLWSNDTVYVVLQEFVAPTVSLSFAWGDTSVTHLFRPEWMDNQPNGPHCPPTCRYAIETIRF